jgi:hypothetical protein
MLGRDINAVLGEEILCGISAVQEPGQLHS